MRWPWQEPDPPATPFLDQIDDALAESEAVATRSQDALDDSIVASRLLRKLVEAEARRLDALARAIPNPIDRAIFPPHPRTTNPKARPR